MAKGSSPNRKEMMTEEGLGLQKEKNNRMGKNRGKLKNALFLLVSFLNHIW